MHSDECIDWSESKQEAPKIHTSQVTENATWECELSPRVLEQVHVGVVGFVYELESQSTWLLTCRAEVVSTVS